MADSTRNWRIWDLDSELRYRPVVDALGSHFPVCEVGSGPTGIAAWTDQPVIGVDPGADDRHGATASPPNFRRIEGSGANIPLPDRSVPATIAVDTFEHIPQAARAAVVREMERVTMDGGRVIIMGPTGGAAADGDRYVLERWRTKQPASPIAHWLSEHEEIGLPTRDEIRGLFGPRVVNVRARGVFSLRFWRMAHRALLGDFPRPLGHDKLHPIVWAPLGFLARRYHRGSCYRELVIADLA